MSDSLQGLSLLSTPTVSVGVGKIFESICLSLCSGVTKSVAPGGKKLNGAPTPSPSSHPPLLPSPSSLHPLHLPFPPFP